MFICFLPKFKWQQNTQLGSACLCVFCMALAVPKLKQVGRNELIRAQFQTVPVCQSLKTWNTPAVSGTVDKTFRLVAPRPVILWLLAITPFKFSNGHQYARRSGSFGDLRKCRARANFTGVVYIIPSRYFFCRVILD